MPPPRPIVFKPLDRHEAQRHFIATVIESAVLIAQGERSASDEEIENSIEFLRSEKCRRWLGYLDLDISCLEHVSGDLGRFNGH